VHAVAAGTVRSDAFALSNAVYEGNRTLALDAIREMKAERIDSIVALGMLIRIYQELLPVAILVEDGKEQKDIEAMLKINPFRLKHMFKAARSIGLTRLGESVAALSEIDVASKNGGVCGYSSIETFLLKYL
jgi:DNA polymerase III delta subunit